MGSAAEEVSMGPAGLAFVQGFGWRLGQDRSLVWVAKQIVQECRFRTMKAGED